MKKTLKVIQQDKLGVIGKDQQTPIKGGRIIAVIDDENI